MIETLDQLAEWISDTRTAHLRVNDECCSCGWTFNGDGMDGRGLNWKHHLDLHLSELGDLLGSDSMVSEKDGFWIAPWRTECEHLQTCIDWRDEDGPADWHPGDSLRRPEHVPLLLDE